MIVCTPSRYVRFGKSHDPCRKLPARALSVADIRQAPLLNSWSGTSTAPGAGRHTGCSGTLFRPHAKHGRGSYAREQMSDSTRVIPPGDFDFIIGDWRVRHRRLNSRLTGCNDWTEFSGTSSTRKILGGFGNVEDNVLFFPDGEVRAAAFRSFDARSRQWAIWWLDGRSPHNLDVPVVGGFIGTVGTFLANDSLDGRPIAVRFIWNVNVDSRPVWEQAFSEDGGTTWETNWIMEFNRQ